MVIHPTPANNSRLGFHYFPDAEHYRESDLHAWLPELRAMGASWLVLLSPATRAIPEQFLTGLIEAGIEPVLHFPFSLAAPPNPKEHAVLFEHYARCGVHYVALFDRPNARYAWPASAWSQQDLVERFLDRFVPLAGSALKTGLLPALPPLEPGGNYWDTAFLRAALQSLERRGRFDLLDRLVLSAHGCAGQRPLNWGSGGPERWPAARPYFTPPGSEDQRGFHIFDWYLAISEAVLGKALPVLLLGVGSRPASQLFQTGRNGLNKDSSGKDCQSRNGRAPVGHGYSGNGHSRVEDDRVEDDRVEDGRVEDDYLHRNLAIAGALTGGALTGGAFSGGALSGAKMPGPNLPFNSAESQDAIPEQVLAGNFWLLAAGAGSPHRAQAWFSQPGRPGKEAQALRHWVAAVGGSPAAPKNPYFAGYSPRPIAHYLLLPSFDWGVSDWHLNAVRPFVKKYRPVVGFSLSEAACADRVTVIGGPEHFSDAALQALSAGGCFVERIGGDGISIATILAEK